MVHKKHDNYSEKGDQLSIANFNWTQSLLKGTTFTLLYYEATFKLEYCLESS